MLSENGQALVAIVVIFLAIGLVKSFASQVLYPAVGVLIVTLLVDHFFPDIQLLVTLQSWWVYFESQLPPDLWSQIADGINQASDWIIQIFSNAAASNLTDTQPVIPTPPPAQ